MGVEARTCFLSNTSILRVYQSLPGLFELSISAFLQLQIDFGVMICVEHPAHLPLCHDVLSNPQVSRRVDPPSSSVICPSLLMVPVGCIFLALTLNLLFRPHGC